MNLTYAPFVNKMKSLFNITSDSFSLLSIGGLYDTLTCDKYLGRPLPKDFTDDDYQNMKHIFYWKILFEHDLNIMKAQNSRKFQKVIDTFDARTKSLNDYPLKWTFLSSHDTHVAPL